VKGPIKAKSPAGSGARTKTKTATKHSHKKMTAKQYAAYLKYVRKHFPNRGKAASRTTAKTKKTTKRTLTLNGGSVQFGRNKPYTKEEKPRLVLDSYLAASLPKAHAVVDRASKVDSWPMYDNDSIGDCTCAAVGHVIQAWTAYAGTEATINDFDVLAAYEAVSGYNPATGANDNGAAEQDVLNYWRKTGVGGHKILAFAQLEDLENLTMAKQAVDLFGSLYIGLDIPDTAMQQFMAGEPWDVVKGAQIEGGHAVPVQYWGTNEAGEIGVVTWGKLQRMTRAFWRAYVEEAWVVISQDWLNANGDTIEGFDLAQLEADFTALTGDSLR
jgi:hypothetical protein